MTQDQYGQARVPGYVVRSDAVPAHAGNGATSAPYPEDQVGEAAGMLGDFSDLTYGDLLPDAAQYTARWQQVQFKFVDDPHASVTEAADIIAQVTARLEAAIQERQNAIAEQQRSLRDRWGEGTNADTPRGCARRCGCTAPSSTSSSAPRLVKPSTAS